MNDTQLNEAENFDNPPEMETQSNEEKFLGVKSSVGIDRESNIEVEVIDDRPKEDRKPPKKETSDNSEEISDLSENANKRIKKLKYDYHEERRRKEEAERLRDEAVNYAKRAVTENERLSRLVGTGQEELIKQAKQKAEYAKQSAAQNYKKAYEDGDADAIAKAQQVLTEATLASQQAEYLPQQLANQVLQEEQKQQQNVQPQQQQPAVPKVPEPDPQAVEWQKDNTWFGTDEEMTNFAYGVHAKLVKENVDPTSKEYYDRVDQRMREVFPQEFDIEESYQEVAEPEDTRKSQPTPPNVVAPATRNNGARPNKVKLTATQVSLARKLGITPEQYAAELIKEKR